MDKKLEDAVKAAISDVMTWDQLADRVLELEEENAALRQQLEDTKQCYEFEIRNLKNRLSKQIDDNLNACWENALLTERLARLVEAGKKTLSITDCRGFFPNCDCIRCQLKQAIAEAENELAAKKD
jgi:hypothetical protein